MAFPHIEETGGHLKWALCSCSWTATFCFLLGDCIFCFFLFPL